jgi:CRISPR-associated exonuclease Cas4
MTINATLINLYHVCKREMWLHANGIRMEQNSEAVADGKLIGETTYQQRAEKYTEVELSATFNNIALTGKVDFYNANSKIIHETKRSDKAEQAHEWQVKYYIWLLQQNGVDGVTGILEYPKLRETTKVELLPADIEHLQRVIKQINAIIEDENCPARLNSKICTQCSYYDFCYVSEQG